MLEYWRDKVLPMLREKDYRGDADGNIIDESKLGIYVIGNIHDKNT